MTQQRKNQIKKMKQRRIRRIIECICIVILAVTLIGMFGDLIRFPEKYLTTWNYQLKNELQSGENVTWYHEHYIEKGELLWYDNLDERLLREYYRISKEDWEITYNTLNLIHGKDFTKKEFLKYILKEGVDFDEIRNK